MTNQNDIFVSGMKNRTLILDEKQSAQKIERMAWQIIENNSHEKEIVLAGIANRGYLLAERLGKRIQSISKINVHLAEIKIDKKDPFQKEPALDCSNEDFAKKSVVIVDDVLNSGRTMLFATKPFMNVPVKNLTIAVLLNRSYRNFPVAAKYIGMSLSTTIQENIVVDFDGKGIRAYLE